MLSDQSDACPQGNPVKSTPSAAAPLGFNVGGFFAWEAVEEEQQDEQDRLAEHPGFAITPASPSKSSSFIKFSIISIYQSSETHAKAMPSRALILDRTCMR